MLFQTLPFAFGLLSLIPCTVATREFTNHGTLDGWSKPKPEADGTVTEVTNSVFEGSSALKMTQTYKPGYEGRYHAEVVYPDGYKRGDSKFYSFAFRLGNEWDFDGDQSYNIGQFIADFGDTGCDDWSPTTMIYLKGDTLYSRIKTGQLLPGKPCPSKSKKSDCSGGKNCQKTREFKLQDGIEGGTWYKMIFQVDWKSDATGLFKTWVNGTVVHEENNIPTTVLDDKRSFSFRLGLYANGWHDDHELQGNQDHRQVWIDEVVVGSSFADVDS